MQVTDKTITSIDAHHNRSGEAIRLSAPVFIDCTGDAWVGYRAGAEFRYGRESKNEFAEGWDKHKELWSPEKPDKWTMGISVLWNSQEAAAPVSFPEVPWAKPHGGFTLRLACPPQFNPDPGSSSRWTHDSTQLNCAIVFGGPVGPGFRRDDGGGGAG